MSNLVRFGISLDRDLLETFDERIRKKKYTNRSEAIRDLIREDLLRQDWREGETVAAAITMVYDHHQRGLVASLMDIQHDYHHAIISSQHVHLDHHNCLEIIVAKGTAEVLEELHGRLKAQKGVFHVGLAIASAMDDEGEHHH